MNVDLLWGTGVVLSILGGLALVIAGFLVVSLVLGGIFSGIGGLIDVLNALSSSPARAPGPAPPRGKWKSKMDVAVMRVGVWVLVLAVIYLVYHVILLFRPLHD
jgi:hypothetical protein